MKINFEIPLIKKILHIISALYHGNKVKTTNEEHSSLIVSVKKNYPNDWKKILTATEELIEASKKRFSAKEPFFTQSKIIKCRNNETKQIDIMKFYSAWHPNNKNKLIKNTTKRPVTQIKIINADGSIEEYLDIVN
jgi:hypothetical protein